MDREANGVFAIGHKVNNQPWTPYGDRVKMLLEKYTRKDIREIAADPDRLDALSSRDAMIIIQLAGATTNIEPSSRAEVKAERETLLDRVEGKPKGDIDALAQGALSLADLLTSVHQNRSDKAATILDVTPDSLTGESASSLEGGQVISDLL